MGRPRKERSAGKLTVQLYASMLLYDEVKAGIVHVLRGRKYVNRSRLARLVAVEYFRVKGLGGKAFKAFEQVVLECAGHLTPHTVEFTPDKNYVYRGEP